MAAILSKLDIELLLKKDPPLVESYISLSEQLQPNGFDLTLSNIAIPQSSGIIAVNNNQRKVSHLESLIFDGLDFMDLMPGIYIITYNEVIHLPRNIMALAKPRSSLLRCGVTVHTAVWDAGYSGRSQSLLVVYHSHGFRLQKNSRIIQLVFFKLSRETEGYRGKYQNENIS